MAHNLCDLITLQARRLGDAPAVLLPHTAIGYRRFDALVWRAATALARAGVARGQVVALTIADELTHLIAACALARLGATQLPLPAREPPPMRAAIAASARAAALLTDLDTVDDAGLATLRADGAAWYADASPIDPDVRDPASAVPWLIMTGSGTTGRPKLMPLTHDAWLARLAVQRTLLPVLPGEPVLAIGSLDFATTRHRYLEALASGAAIALFDRGREGLKAACRRAGVRVMYASPTHLRRMLARQADDGRLAFPGLRVLRVGNATVDDTLRRLTCAHLSPNLHVAYSSNEFGPATVAGPADIARTPGTVGRWSSACSVRVVDADGRDCRAGEDGAVLLRGSGCIDGYLDDPQADARAFRDGWFAPGDLGALTDDGQLVHRGRLDDMMSIDGINVFPAEIEAVLGTHPAVAEAAAFALASSLHGEIPMCAVILRPGMPATAQTLLAYAAERLGSRAPRRVFVVPELPRTPNGKALRRLLPERLGLAPH